VRYESGEAGGLDARGVWVEQILEERPEKIYLTDDVTLEQGDWASQEMEAREKRDFCPEVAQEVADAVYHGGLSRPVRRVAWDLCDDRPDLCEVLPAAWGPGSEGVPTPTIFLQSNPVMAENCLPLNRLVRGVGPAAWIAHLKSQGSVVANFAQGNEVLMWSDFISLAIMEGSLVLGLPLLYQSDFTGSNLAAEGLYTQGGANGYWTLDTVNNYATGVNTGGNPRAGLYTTDTWSNGNGFTLKVRWRNVASMTRFSLGLLTSSYATTGNLDPFNQSASGAYGIGFSAAGELGGRLLFNNGTTTTILSSAQGNETIIGFEQTLEITVSRNLWSYSLNGAAPTTGAFTFETGLSYRFAAWSQNIPNSQILSIEIS
jgi:hypothetical protein